MSDLTKILDQIRRLPGCTVLPANGLPRLRGNDRLPPEVEDFYTQCGGIRLHCGSPCSIALSSPEGFLPADIAILGEDDPTDISTHWYVMASDGKRQSISIDTAPERAGRCYDSFDEQHAVRGESQIIARSLGELLTHLSIGQGHSWYWLHPDWVPLGDAYDGVDA